MQSKKRALGKGLAALLPTKTESAATEHLIAAATEPAIDSASDREALMTLPVDAIRPNPLQPRQQFDEAALDALAASIRERGLLQPVLVTRRQGEWVLVAGERRWRAAQRAGLESLPALVLDLSDQEALEIALIENLQREDLNPLEEARAYRVLMEQFGLSQEEIALRVEKSRPAVANALRLLNLPDDIQADVESGRLSAGHARSLLALPTPEAQRHWRDIVLRRGLSVRQLEAEIQQFLARSTKPRPRQRLASSTGDAAVQDLRRRFEEALGCKVLIVLHGPERGKVEISFTSLDELDRIKEALGVLD